jgi:uncharacterized protein (TIGR02594 family)
MFTHRTTASILRLRSGAGTDSAILGRLPQGTLLEALQQPRQGWLRVQAELVDGSLSGWVSMDHIAPLHATPRVPVVEPPWMAAARSQVGMQEYPGEQHNPRILAYHQTTTLRATTDETPWCSSFVNWCMVQAGLQGTNSAAARSWLQWGRPVTDPVPGCVAVFRRGSSPTSGHVAFFLEKRGTGILVLGGNQSNSVNVSSYLSAALLGYRMPG